MAILTPQEIDEIKLEMSVRRFSLHGETEVICSKGAEAIAQLQAQNEKLQQTNSDLLKLLEDRHQEAMYILK